MDIFVHVYTFQSQTQLWQVLKRLLDALRLCSYIKFDMKHINSPVSFVYICHENKENHISSVFSPHRNKTVFDLSICLHVGWNEDKITKNRPNKPV